MTSQPLEQTVGYSPGHESLLGRMCHDYIVPAGRFVYDTARESAHTLIASACITAAVAVARSPLRVSAYAVMMLALAAGCGRIEEPRNEEPTIDILANNLPRAVFSRSPMWPCSYDEGVSYGDVVKESPTSYSISFRLPGKERFLGFTMSWDSRKDLTLMISDRLGTRATYGDMKSRNYMADRLGKGWQPHKRSWQNEKLTDYNGRKSVEGFPLAILETISPNTILVTIDYDRKGGRYGEGDGEVDAACLVIYPCMFQGQEFVDAVGRKTFSEVSGEK